MPSTITDRLNGLTTSVAVKAPCRVATIGAVILSGLQAIDGVALSARDRVLVKDQADATDNGIYAASASAWRRTPDFDGSLDAVGGTLIPVTSGSVNANSFWQIDGHGLIIVGRDEITFEATSGNLSLQTDLASTAPDKGAALVGHDPAATYPDGSTGKAINLLNEASPWLLTDNGGAFAYLEANANTRTPARGPGIGHLTVARGSTSGAGVFALSIGAAHVAVNDFDNAGTFAQYSTGIQTVGAAYARSRCSASWLYCGRNAPEYQSSRPIRGPAPDVRRGVALPAIQHRVQNRDCGAANRGE